MSDPKPGNIVWFDLFVNDSQRAISFYGCLFGWTFDPMTGMEGLYTINTGDGSLLGSLLPRSEPSKAEEVGRDFQTTGLYVQVPDVNESLAVAAELGAKTLIDPMPIPGTGNVFALVRDPEQNNIGLVATAS